MADKEGTIHLDRYTADAKQVVAGAQQIADERQHSEVTPLHLLVRLLERDRGVCEVFRRSGADPNEAMQLADAQLKKLPTAKGAVAYVSPRLMDLLNRAERESSREKAPSVGVEHLLHALAQEIRGPRATSSRRSASGPARSAPTSAPSSRPARTPRPASPRRRSDASSATSYVRDLVAEAKEGASIR
jgi:ATP-dependent Clp protease ATP-binding subunit ClpB